LPLCVIPRVEKPVMTWYEFLRVKEGQHTGRSFLMDQYWGTAGKKAVEEASIFSAEANAAV